MNDSDPTVSHAMRIVAFGDYRFDLVNRILSRGEEELPLPPRVLSVLARLLDEPGSVVSKQALIDTVWSGAYVTETSLSEAVGLLRQALHDSPQNPRYIQTVHRRGYRFIAPVREESAQSIPDSGERTAERTRARFIAATAAALLLLLAGFLVARRRSAPESPRPPMARFAVPAPASRELLDSVPSLAVSADGRHLVYTVRRGEETALFHRDISALSSREISGTRGALAPFFSADGRRVGFFLDGQLVAVPLAGGTALPVASVKGMFWGASWNEDASLVYAAGLPASLYRARPGGVAERLTQPHTGRDGVLGHVWPRVLPGGESVLFTMWSTTLADARVEWLSLVTGERRTVLAGASDCRFAKGLLVCARAGGTIAAARFDPHQGRLTGPVLPLLRDVAVHPGIGFAQLALGGGTLIYLPGTQHQGVRTLQRLLSGKPAPLAAPARLYRNFKEGPHGQIAATVLHGDRSDVWVIDAANGMSSRLTFRGFNIEPVWSRDGRWVAFASNEAGPFNIYRRRADGSGAVERVRKSAHHQFPVSWSPDGRELMLAEYHPATGSDLWVMDLATRKVMPWLRTNAKEVNAAWSPDGRWIAYTSGETGRWEVYVRGYPDGRGRWQVSTDGGADPSWSADGRTIYFMRHPSLGRGAELWAVPVIPTAGALTPGRAAKLFDGRGLVSGAAGPGGVLFMADEAQAPKPAEVRVVLDWPSALPPSATTAR
jgi:serine/threonine-protein kinase